MPAGTVTDLHDESRMHEKSHCILEFVSILPCLWLQGEDGEFWTDIPNTQIRRVTAKRLLEAKQVSQWLLRGVSSSATAALPCGQAGRLILQAYMLPCWAGALLRCVSHFP